VQHLRFFLYETRLGVGFYHTNGDVPIGGTRQMTTRHLMDNVF
jgi:hypothetical protein